MFLLAAETRRMSAVDPRRERAEQALAAMEGEYFASLEGKAPPAPRRQDEPWRVALQYVGAVFSSLDAAEDEPDHEAQKALRKSAWDIVSGAVLEKYVGGGEAKKT